MTSVSTPSPFRRGVRQLRPAGLVSPIDDRADLGAPAAVADDPEPAAAVGGDTGEAHRLVFGPSVGRCSASACHRAVPRWAGCRRWPSSDSRRRRGIVPTIVTSVNMEASLPLGLGRSTVQALPSQRIASGMIRLPMVVKPTAQAVPPPAAVTATRPSSAPGLEAAHPRPLTVDRVDRLPDGAGQAPHPGPSG